MSLPHALFALLAAIALLSAWRAWRRARIEGWSRARRFAVMALQPLLAGLLALALWPPAVPGERATLVVLTAGATPPATLGPGEILVALPEAGASDRLATAPDLATALRRTPAAALRVLGAGLEARDREAARGLPLAFAPGEPPQGLVALRWPGEVLAGTRFTIDGEIAGADAASVELRDPGGERIARVRPGDDGRFALAAIAGVPGAVAYTLRMLDAEGESVEQATLPVQVAAGAAHRVMLLSGAPNPETKYLRRWALDAGLVLSSRQAVGGGIALGGAPARLAPEILADTDLLVLDERTWRALGERGRGELLAAVDGGLGLLLRIGGELTAGERASLARLGFVLSPEPGPRAVTLPPDRLPAVREGEAAPTLSRAPYSLRAPGGETWLATEAGAPLAAWQSRGQGRVGVWLPVDSFRWVLAGHAGAHGRLWAEAVAILARPRAAASPLRVPAWSRAGERVSLCGLGGDALMQSPDGTTVPLAVDPGTGAAACAAAWPRVPGRHRIVADGHEAAWTVFAADALPGLAARERREATMALAALSPEGAADAPAPEVPGPRWPWWAAWLVAAALAWWLERPRRA